MSYVIAVDIDGTLLSSRGTVLPGTIEWLDRARSQGAHVLISSGRPVSGIHRIRRLSGIDGPVAISAYNGAIVTGADGQPLADHRLPADVAREVFTRVRPRPVSQMACQFDELFADDPEGYLVWEEADGNDLAMTVVDDLRTLSVDPHKVLFAGSTAALGEMADDLTAAFGAFQVTASSLRYTELVPAGAGKGESLKAFCAAVGVPVSQSVAFGDAHNDLDMLQVAGLGVAMGNAHAQVQQIADRVTGTNDEGGIEQVLAEIFG